MQAHDVVHITADQNPAMFEKYRDAKPGDKCEFEIQGTLKSMDAEGMDITIDAAVPDGYEVADDDESIQPNSPMGSPLSSDSTMSPAAMLVRRKTAKETSGHN